MIGYTGNMYLCLFQFSDVHIINILNGVAFSDKRYPRNLFFGNKETPPVLLRHVYLALFAGGLSSIKLHMKEITRLSAEFVLVLSFYHRFENREKVIHSIGLLDYINST